MFRFTTGPGWSPWSTARAVAPSRAAGAWARPRGAARSRRTMAASAATAGVLVFMSDASSIACDAPAHAGSPPAGANADVTRVDLLARGDNGPLRLASRHH